MNGNGWVGGSVQQTPTFASPASPSQRSTSDRAPLPFALFFLEAHHHRHHFESLAPFAHALWHVWLGGRVGGLLAWWVGRERG